MSNQSKGRPGGVLPINAVATKKTNAAQKSSQRSPAPKLRLIIRRLPPGLTETEFCDAMGAEWQAGNGKVDWQAFKEGKVTKDPSKPSRPGRAYIKVKDQSLLETLSAKIKSTTFKDAKNTGGDPCLVGPPSLEFAPYNKVPSGRNRHDGRQGTIDQDQEFIDFLQSLTEPITKPAVNGSELSEVKQDKAITTPLLQFIKEKKANKAKEKEAAAAAKSSKKNQEGKEGKTKGEARPTIVVKSNAASAEKSRVAKATQEAVKAVNKSVAQIQSKTPASKSEQKASKETSAQATPTAAAATTTTPKPERQRGSASAASRLIARDLGLTPKEPRTQRTAKNTTANANANANATSTTTTTAIATETKPKSEQPAKSAQPTSETTPKPTTTSTPSTTAPPTGPRNNRATQPAPAKTASAVPSRPSKPPPQPSAGAKSAFLKHANPSQGVTEELLRTTFSAFGEVTRCEIDKKKGLGYVDFTDTETLKKAMAASPIKVGNGQVVVLENKSPYHKRQSQTGNNTQQQQTAATAMPKTPSAVSSTAPSAATSPQPPPAVLASIDSTVVTTAIPVTNTAADKKAETESAKSPTTLSEAPVTPTAPKGARNGGAATRAGRGGAAATSGRGGANQNGNRGRGFRGRGGRGRTGNNATTTAAATTAVGSTPPPSSPAPSASQTNNSEAAKPAAVEN